MDYKKIIKSKKIRNKILEFLSFVPDTMMIKLQYFIKTNRKLNLKNPQRYTEKLQWYKLNYKNPLMVKCVDKYDVRQYVKDKGLEHILNECYGVYNSPDEVDFNAFPDKFVLKDTLGGGGNSIIICEDKNKANIEEYKKIMSEWVNTKLKRSAGREWPYYFGQKHRIIAEKYLADEKNDLPDYKFYCFDGKCEIYYIRKNYTQNHINGQMAFFDNSDKQIKGLSLDYCAATKEQVELPKLIKEMKEISETLSKDFPHCRVDLYCIKNKIYFGELTFYNASGYMTFEPDKFDYELGKKMKLTSYKNK